jgi:hypothetical protein
MLRCIDEALWYFWHASLVPRTGNDTTVSETPTVCMEGASSHPRAKYSAGTLGRGGGVFKTADKKVQYYMIGLLYHLLYHLLLQQMLIHQRTFHHQTAVSIFSGAGKPENFA